MTYLITCSGLTSAQRIKSVLAKSCITAYIVRPPQELLQEGCGYGVEVKEEKLREAIRIIKQYRMSMRKVFKKEGTSYREVAV